MIHAFDIFNAKVLIVDDHNANVQLLEALLRGAGYVSITSTMDPYEVCGLHLRNRYDLILLDLQMPGMDGFQVMEGLKEIESDGYLPVIVITAQPAYKLRALKAGAKDFVSKPFDVFEVKTRIYNMLEVRLLYKEHNHLDQVLQEKNNELESAKSAAEKANLAKSDFLSTVSHELRTPLTSIRGALALIAGGVSGELPAAVKALVDIAHKNSERLILLVNDILDIEKIEAGKMEFNARPEKLMPLLKQALDGNRAYAEQYKVSYELESELPDVMVNVDSNRMMQVFANLLSNAAKYSPAGGKVLIAVERIDRHICVAVKDNGPGIADEFKDRIFQKFAQADSSDTRKKGGTGLGLSIAKAIVEQMGGSIWFDSQPYVQTAFYAELPEWVERKLPETGCCFEGIDKRVNHDRSPAMLNGVERRSGQARPKVLHVEDDPDVFHVIYQVACEVTDMVQATNLASARKMLARSRYDLVILDLDLPDGSGKELLPLLKAASPPIPVLVFSGHEISLEDAKEVDVVLVKSRTDNAQLLTTIKHLIGVR